MSDEAVASVDSARITEDRMVHPPAMTPISIRILIAVLGLCGLSSCERAKSLLERAAAKPKKPVENVDADERAFAAKLKPAVDPIQREISVFRREMHEHFGARHFDELEKSAKELRDSKALFRNGNWKLIDFYESFTCGEDAPENLWLKQEGLHKDWMAAKPESVAARLAYAEFLTDYAWHARGSGYSNTVTEQGWALFRDRLAECAKVLKEARTLPEKDPMWWFIAIRVGLGQSWPKQDFDVLLKDAHAFDSHFWRFDTARANSLLPRWYGEPGDWEAYAEEAADRPEGLGAETYARIIIYMAPYHENVFRDSKASWQRTREGLELLRQKYPDAIEFTSFAAMLATMANDRVAAKAMFDELGETYQPHVWRSTERFAHYRHWAQTGQW